VASYYGTLAEAQAYFDTRLNVGAWERSTVADREKALYQATRAIDNLNFAGDKTDDDQEHQFPRYADADVPTEIEQATYEEAIGLLEGHDPEIETRTIGVMSEAYSGSRTTYDGNHVEEHIRAGLVSASAWRLIRPFLREPRQVRLSRVS
jgi:hypothetical protein